MNTVNVDLPRAYRWRDGTGELYEFGTGKQSIPQGMYDELVRDGLLSAPEPSTASLPDNFPGREKFIAAGHATMDAVRALGNVDDVEGIGPVTAQLVQDYLANGNSN